MHTHVGDNQFDDNQFDDNQFDDNQFDDNQFDGTLPFKKYTEYPQINAWYN